ncbi:general transcription factor II-I repeat domain-containing protein 2-like isoform X2 [Tachypleus tridentatus]|uniref:general transcription factor II-I repeat domain-containing protein 2-like isoform X2 n=1 Tax=Tachypleus tridentatus TaxID=6853 RepID=UPI003FD5679A
MTCIKFNLDRDECAECPFLCGMEAGCLNTVESYVCLCNDLKLKDPVRGCSREPDPIFFSPIVMTPFRRREVDSECRAFNEEWGEKYFFVETKNQKATCVMCTESVAILKEYNLRRHYETKHRSTYLKFSGKFRSEKFESMIRVFGKVMLFVTS